MSSFETPPASGVETAATGGAQHSAQAMEFSAAEKESLQQLSDQLDPNMETPEGMESMEISTEDTERLKQALEASRQEHEARLQKYLEENPDVNVEGGIPLEKIYSAEELAVAQQEAEKLQEGGIDWSYVWKGTKVVGGVLLAMAAGGAIGYGAYTALKALGYGPAMLNIAESALNAAGPTLGKVTDFLGEISNGLSSAWESIKSWEIWSHFSSTIDQNTGEVLEKATDAAQRGNLSDITRPTDFPDLGGFVEPGPTQ